MNLFFTMWLVAIKYQAKKTKEEKGHKAHSLLIMSIIQCIFVLFLRHIEDASFPASKGGPWPFENVSSFSWLHLEERFWALLSACCRRCCWGILSDACCWGTGNNKDQTLWTVWCRLEPWCLCICPSSHWAASAFGENWLLLFCPSLI